ncbi:MAG TPA: hypothetical protein VLD19_11890 [Chitinophagaceae bacterium]|nr:hypothetical protein [Chitinophagaceae bacterium]
MNITALKNHFWKWFRRNADEYQLFFQAGPKEMVYLMNELDTHLVAYCKYLAATLTHDANTGRILLTISANGYARAFNRADKLVAKAPVLPGWDIQSLQAPRAIDFLVHEFFPDVPIEPHRLWFTPLEKPAAGQRQDIRVYSELYSRDTLPGFGQAVRHILMNVLGERTLGLDIGELRLANTSEARRPEQLQRLEELPAFLGRRNSYILEVGEDGTLKQRY